MSEEKAKRTIPDIQQEYSSLCTKAGHLQYQIDALTQDLTLVNKTLRDLNFEAAAIQAATAKEEAAKPAAIAAPTLTAVPAPEAEATA